LSPTSQQIQSQLPQTEMTRKRMLGTWPSKLCQPPASSPSLEFSWNTHSSNSSASIRSTRNHKFHLLKKSELSRQIIWSILVHLLILLVIEVILFDIAPQPRWTSHSVSFFSIKNEDLLPYLVSTDGSY
jgi:hypothetical protein